jgi:O-antigen/teichoic acid export membrane protein
LKKRIAGTYHKLRATNILSNFFNLSGIQLSNVLLIILIIPVITRSIGIYEFGIVMFAQRFSQLAGSVINWGTGQSGVRDVAFNLNDPKKLGIVFYNTLFIRVVIFVFYLILLFVLQWFHVGYYTYILLSVPIALAEVFNPLCFFIGAERLRLFNIYNLVFNIAGILALFVFIKGPGDAVWVNLILGMANVITYLVLMVYFSSRFKLPFYLPLKSELLKIGKDNFYLTVNNISGNLQQSIIIFALPRWGYSVLLGPYALCDRIIGQCRNLLITISNAIYPNAARVYQESAALWNVYRRKTKYLLEGVFFAGAILIFMLADFIVFTLSKEHNATAVLFLRIMAFVPTISAFNVVNVLDQLLKKNNVYIFRIAMVLMVISVLVAFVVLNIGNYLVIGAFTLIVEASSWLLYEYIVKKTSLQNA